MKKTSLCYTVAALAVVALAPLEAADKNKAWTDPAAAKKEDPDFLIQGEYGEAKKGLPIGVQVVALGDGKFDAYFLEGGLPGHGWTREKKRVKITGTKAADGSVSFGPSPEGVQGKLSGGKLVASKGDKSITLSRIERQSPTVGAKPPQGAFVLFDGTDAKHWKKGKVVDGLLASTGTTSIPTFNDCSIHLEFRTPYKPHARGQGRGNSGVYYMGRWETQVLDSFGLNGEMNECGGIYSIAKSRINMCLPPLTWQTYDVDYTGAKFDKDGKRTAWPRISVKLNGVLIHENQELNKTHTTAAPVGGAMKDEGGPIFLQAHGNAVFYRNIWVLPKKG